MEFYHYIHLRNSFFCYCFILNMLSVSLPIWAENSSYSPKDGQLMPYQGHYIGASIGMGPSSGIGYRTPEGSENPWVKGDPNNGIGWKVDYYWLPRHSHRKTVTFGVGLQYTGAHSHGNDQIVIRDFLYDSPQSLTVNYIAPQCVMKILTRSDTWTFNIRAGVGLGHSAFSGKISRIPQGDNRQSFSTSKYGFGRHLGIGVEAKVSPHFSLTAEGTLCILNIKNVMHNDVIRMYDAIQNRNMSVVPFAIGVCYHP